MKSLPVCNPERATASVCSKVITGLRPGILYAFRVYAENGVGVTYSGYQTVKIPVE